MKFYRISNYLPFVLIMFTYGCNAQKESKQKYKDITLSNFTGDSCLTLINAQGDTLSFFRLVEVIENTFNDTLVVSGGVIHPGDKRTHFLGQVGTTKGGSMYSEEEYIKWLDESDHPEGRTKFICIYPYPYDSKKDLSYGKITFRVELRE